MATPKEDPYICSVCGHGPDYVHNKECMIRLMGRSDMYLHNVARMDFWRKQVTQAQDRAAALKLENNALRKKLRKMEAQVPNSKRDKMWPTEVATVVCDNCGETVPPAKAGCIRCGHDLKIGAQV